MKKNNLMLVGAVLFTAFVFPSNILAQNPDARTWDSSLSQVKMLNSNVWMQAPRIARQNGNVLFWPRIQNFAPNINALFDPYTGSIWQYRAASLPMLRRFGFRIIRERVLYGRIWEVESVTPANGLRYFQRAFETENGIVVVTATARANVWGNASVAQMMRTMQTLMVYY